MCMALVRLNTLIMPDIANRASRCDQLTREIHDCRYVTLQPVQGCEGIVPMLGVLYHWSLDRYSVQAQENAPVRIADEATIRWAM